MKLAVITDSSAFLQAETLRKEDLFVLDIPVNIDGQEYVEGVNLTAQEFYEKMARSSLHFYILPLLLPAPSLRRRSLHRISERSIGC